ncbi:MAG: 16S rRNA (cytosine(1402)-N(4))-methyltransferase RsmH [Gammaproteobacteria bacterium]|nr:MAG: 16S rRNA (cytosine(1402)-N(4))-methyltransferase RsmH [Gammaproteobacteria bacterium]
MTGNVYTHQPVMLEEVLEALDPAPDACILDATFGRGGHARALLARLGPSGRLLALDRDPEAIAAARALAEEDARVLVAQAPFAELARVVAAQDLKRPINGVLMDLGVSSPQLDDPARGFSFQHDGPLDMRMGADARQTAADWIARASADDMIRVFQKLGEERYARRIARGIVAARTEAPITTTGRLAEVVSAAHPAWERDKHPATRVFLAIRLHINSELEQVASGLAAAVDVLAPGGRLAVISFHSLEDRIVKRFLRDEERGDPVLRALPVPGDRTGARLRRMGGARRPSAAEVSANPRARSATLRVAERLPEAA